MRLLHRPVSYSSGRVAAALISATILSTGAAAKPAPSPRHRQTDPRDERIATLEAQINALTKAVEQLQAERSGTASASATPQPTPPARALASAAVTHPVAPFTPDQLHPSSAAGQIASEGGATIIAGKPSIQSSDGRFIANLHGVMQFDAGGYFQKAAGPVTTDLRRGGSAADTAHARNLSNGTFFRRARIGMDGKLFGDFDYNVLFEFGGAGQEDSGHIQEMWLQYSGLKPFHLRIGAFPPSIGLEDQGSTNGSLFLERPAISDVVRGIAAGDFREAMQLAASRKRWFVSLALTTRVVGVANSSASGSAPPFDQALGGVARAAFVPVQGDDYMLLSGVHGAHVFSITDSGGPDVAAAGRYPVTLQERPELRIDGTRLISTGAINASHVNTGGVELAAQKQQFFVQGEYEVINIERRDSILANPHFSGWYVEGGWVLTGERRRFNSATFAFDAPAVDHPFDIANGTYGAFELAARYSVTDLNYHEGGLGTAATAEAIRGGEQKVIAGGINWYLNPAVRFMLQYQHVKIDRLSPNATSFVTPIGAEIGQSYNTLAVRSQLAF